MTYRDVIEKFQKKVSQCIIDEDYDPRPDLPICAEDIRDVVWMRDDAVKLLVERINELEKAEEEVGMMQ